MPDREPTDRERQQGMNPKLRDAFRKWCEPNSVDANGFEDDWGPWWDCFLMGAHAGQEILRKEGRKEPRR
jgi:hypothetical protein